MNVKAAVENYLGSAKRQSNRRALFVLSLSTLVLMVGWVLWGPGTCTHTLLALAQALVIMWLTGDCWLTQPQPPSPPQP